MIKQKMILRPESKNYKIYHDKSYEEVFKSSPEFAQWNIDNNTKHSEFFALCKKYTK